MRYTYLLLCYKEVHQGLDSGCAKHRRHLHQALDAQCTKDLVHVLSLRLDAIA